MWLFSLLWACAFLGVDFLTDPLPLTASRFLQYNPFHWVFYQVEILNYIKNIILSLLVFPFLIMANIIYISFAHMSRNNGGMDVQAVHCFSDSVVISQIFFVVTSTKDKGT